MANILTQKYSPPLLHKNYRYQNVCVQPERHDGFVYDV